MKGITDINYPLIYEIDLVIPDDSIPFPEEVDDTPTIDYPLTESIDPTLITNNIPIVITSVVKNHFFCFFSTIRVSLTPKN